MVLDHTRMMLRGPVLCWLLLAGACSNSSPSVETVRHEMLVAVSPEDFLGDVPCLPEDGAMRGYVTTLVNVQMEETLDGGGTSPRTSPLVPCEQTVVFGKGDPNQPLLTQEQHYAAQVYGYERLDLKPVEDDPETLTDATGTVIPPSWSFTCGRMPYDGIESDEVVNWGETGAALAWDGTTRFVRGCQQVPTTAPSDESGQE